MQPISPAIRKSCDGTTPDTATKFLGGCSQMYRNDLTGIRKLVNVTKMKNPADCSTWIDCYPIAEQFTAPDCSEYNNGGCPDNPCYVCGDCVNGHNFCFDQLSAYEPIFKPCADGETQINVGSYHNCFSVSNETMSIAKCRAIGFKNLYANKQFSGRRSYLDRELNAPFNLPDRWAWCCESCYWHDEDKIPSNTKYLAVSATSAIESTVTYLGVASTVTGEAEASCHVDHYGNFYVDSCSSGSSDTSPDSDCYVCGADGSDGFSCAKRAKEILGAADSDRSTLIETWCRILHAAAIDCVGGSGTPPCNCPCAGCPIDGTCFNVVSSGGDGIWHVEIHTMHLGSEVISLSADITPTTLDIYEYGNTADDAWIETRHHHIEYTDTTMVDELTCHNIPSHSVDVSESQSVNGSLSSPYTSEEVYNEARALLKLWDFGDEATYPWRTDGKVTQGPLITYDEGTTEPVISSINDQCESRTPYSGDVVGLPAPAGTDRFWNPYHKNYCTCESLVQPGCLIFYIHDQGAWSTDIHVPCATQWLDEFQANNFGQGAFALMNQMYSVPSTCNSNGPQRGSDDSIWVCKYAEVVFPKQSYSYDRPTGLDRLQVSKSIDGSCFSPNCVASVDVGTDITVLISPDGECTDIQNNEYVWLCSSGSGAIFDADLSGLYKVKNRDSDTQITLYNPRIISASLLPDVPIADCGTGVIGKLRWQSLKPAIGGHIIIANCGYATTSSLITCSLADASYLINNDVLTISGSQGLTDINGSWPVIVKDSQTIYLSGSEAITHVPYTASSGHIYSTDAPDWKWHDTSTKNDYTAILFNFNYRAIGEWQRMSNDITQNNNALQCDGVTSCDSYIPDIGPSPRANQVSCSLDQAVSNVSCSTHCLPLTSCKPVVIYNSPNVTESFVKAGSPIASARNHGFPVYTGSVSIGNYFTPDMEYGALWRNVFRQEMGDPLFIDPSCPCGDNGDGTFSCEFLFDNWNQDDGTCFENNVPIEGWYAHRDIFEARCSIPLGSPDLPSGVYLGCLPTTAFTSSVTCPGGNVCQPPYVNASVCIYDFQSGESCAPFTQCWPYATPWLYYLRARSCVCGEGRFADIYRANGIGCASVGDQFTVPPP